MKALIRSVLHLSQTHYEDICGAEDKFIEAWEQVKYYLTTVSQVKFE